jgi:adenosylhomocysteinase
VTLTYASCVERGLGRLPDKARDLAIVVVQHIREDTRIALRQMRNAGLNVPLVLGIGYSVDPLALDAMREDDFLVEICDPLDLTKRLRQFLELCEDSSSIIVDVGGYAADLVTNQHYARKLVGVVEETNNGLWRYESGSASIPVVQIARCPNKDPENIEVGEAIVCGTSRVLDGLGRKIDGERFAVLGYGGIGENVMTSLSRRGLQCEVFDTNPIRRMLAHTRGHSAPPRQTMLATASVILGCSGHASLFPCDTHLLRNDVLLISGSSKRIEYSEFMTDRQLQLVHLGLPFDVASDGKALLVNHGEPINFVFGSLSRELGDFQFANIVGGLACLLEDSPPAGVLELPHQFQTKIAEDWLTIYLTG